MTWCDVKIIFQVRELLGLTTFFSFWRFLKHLDFFWKLFFNAVDVHQRGTDNCICDISVGVKLCRWWLLVIFTWIHQLHLRTSSRPTLVPGHCMDTRGQCGTTICILHVGNAFSLNIPSFSEVLFDVTSLNDPVSIVLDPLDHALYCNCHIIDMTVGEDCPLFKFPCFLFFLWLPAAASRPSVSWKAADRKSVV